MVIKIHKQIIKKIIKLEWRDGALGGCVEKKIYIELLKKTSAFLVGSCLGLPWNFIWFSISKKNIYIYSERKKLFIFFNFQRIFHRISLGPRHWYFIGAIKTTHLFANDYQQKQKSESVSHLLVNGDFLPLQQKQQHPKPHPATTAI